MKALILVLASLTLFACDNSPKQPQGLISKDSIDAANKAVEQINLQNQKTQDAINKNE